MESYIEQTVVNTNVWTSSYWKYGIDLSYVLLFLFCSECISQTQNLRLSLYTQFVITRYCMRITNVGLDTIMKLQWRNNDRDCVLYHQPRDCLLNGLFRRRLKKTSKLQITGLCAGNWLVTGKFLPPPQGPVTRKIFPFYDVIMNLHCQ